MPRAFVEISFTDLLKIVDELGAEERLALMRHLGVDLPRPDEGDLPPPGSDDRRPHRATRPPLPSDTTELELEVGPGRKD